MEEASLIINHPLFLIESGMPLSEELPPIEGQGGLFVEQQTRLRGLIEHRGVEAHLNVLAEYLDNCSSDVLPFKCVETIKNWDSTHTFAFIQAAIHPTHQLRLANGVYAIFTTQEYKPMELLDVIVHCSIWDFYATSNKGGTSERNFHAWLDDPSAWQKVRNAFAVYETKLASDAKSSHRDGLLRLQKILQGIDLWHPAVESTGVLFGSSIVNYTENQLVMRDVNAADAEM
ncbi:hypothetical protein C8R45DRAFT_1108200 [Mycena sanguinolenta]|nr:hypothetical protein C8R45DRAFT_1108200 [Mycena sanguinolenta]